MRRAEAIAQDQSSTSVECITLALNIASWTGQDFPEEHSGNSNIQLRLGTLNPKPTQR